MFMGIIYVKTFLIIHFEVTKQHSWCIFWTNGGWNIQHIVLALVAQDHKGKDKRNEGISPEKASLKLTPEASSGMSQNLALIPQMRNRS